MAEDAKITITDNRESPVPMRVEVQFIVGDHGAGGITADVVTMEHMGILAEEIAFAVQRSRERAGGLRELRPHL